MILYITSGFTYTAEYEYLILAKRGDVLRRDSVVSVMSFSIYYFPLSYA